MPKTLRKQIAGIKFGRLMVVQPSGKDNQGRMMWLCRCECGLEKNIPSRHLLGGRTVSCGCLAREQSKANGRVGGLKMRSTREQYTKFKDGMELMDRHFFPEDYEHPHVTLTNM